VLANLPGEPKRDWRVEDMPADGRYVDWIAGGDPIISTDRTIVIPTLGGLEGKVLVWVGDDEAP